MGELAARLNGNEQEFHWFIRVPGFASWRAKFADAFALESDFLRGIEQPCFPVLRDATLTDEGVSLVWRAPTGPTTRDLLSRLRSEGTRPPNRQPITLPRVVHWIRGLTRVLQALHSQRPYPYVHGAITPDAVVVDEKRDQLQLAWIGIPRVVAAICARVPPTTSSGADPREPGCGTLVGLEPDVDIRGIGQILNALLRGHAGAAAPDTAPWFPPMTGESKALFDRLAALADQCCHSALPGQSLSTADVLAMLPSVEARDDSSRSHDPPQQRCGCGWPRRASARFCDRCSAPYLRPSSVPVEASRLSLHYEEDAGAALLQCHDTGRLADLGNFKLRRALDAARSDPGFATLICLDGLTEIDRMPHQEEAARRVLQEMRGRALLADEVGLGKTIEAGIILKELVVRGMADRVLILCPPQLCEQWQSELHARFGELFLVMGRDVETSLAWACKRLIAPFPVAEHRFHADELRRRAYDVLIVDEAHYLNEPRNWRALDVVRMLTKKYFLLLSATPMHNKLEELYNIITLLRPGHFENLQAFLDRYVDPASPTSVQHADELRDALRQVMIRKQRSDVALEHPIPEREARRVPCTLSPNAKRFYEDLRALLKDALATCRNRYAVDDLSELAERATSSPAALRAAIPGLRRTYRRQFNDALFSQIEAFSLRPGAAELVEPKVRETFKRANDALRDGEKILIFSQYNESARFLYEKAQTGGLVGPFSIYDETASREARHSALLRFRDGPPAVLFCPGEASEGLNLQFARMMINYDLPWDPMRIEQRIGRIQRIGNKAKVVVIINPYLSGTIEENILEVLEKKLGMFTKVVGQVQEIVGKLDEGEDVRTLFRDRYLEEITQDALHERIDKAKDAVPAASARLLDVICRDDESAAGDDFADQEPANW